MVNLEISNENSKTTQGNADGCSICAVVVWYYPTKEFVDNIQSYSPYVSRVIVIDNSPSCNQNLLPEDLRASNFWQKENIGIAAALNFGLQLAEKNGFRFALTMDQDSKFAGEHANLMFGSEFEKLCTPSVAILAPRVEPGEPLAAAQHDSVITSGNIFSVSAWRHVGMFNSSYFIDQVGHEFCYRLRRSGYLIVQSGIAHMEHTVGSPINFKFFGKTLSSSNHNPQRRYYMARNRLYLRREFPEFDRPYIKFLVLDFLGIVLAERQKLRKIFAILLGVLDFQMGKRGKREL